jgi:AcrR family transcriptional regulator
MPDPQLRSDARRNQRRILRAAARLLAANRNATTQQIAEAAEVGRQTVYRRYPTRTALVEAIVAEAVAEFGASLSQIESTSASGAEAVEQLIRSLARISTEYPILLSTHDDASAADDPAGDTTLNDRAVVVDRFETQISRGQKDGTIRPDLAPAVVRHSLFGALTMALRLREQQPEHSRPSPDSVGEQVASLVMDGLRPRTGRSARQQDSRRRTKR